MKWLNKNLVLFLSSLFLFEGLSFLAYFIPAFNYLGVALILIITLYLSFKDLEWGIIILFTELIIGSKGHLFNLGFLSLRMLIFSALLLVLLIKLANKNFRQELIAKLLAFKKTILFIVLAILILFSLLLGIINNNSYVLSDFNAWLFFLIIFPLVAVYVKKPLSDYRRLFQFILAALIFLSFKTLLILYIFTHNLVILPDVYLWLRRTGVAEITNTTASWPRIFLQSHIYPVLTLLVLPWLLKIKQKSAWILMSLFWAVCLLSMSRSFWLAVLVSTILSLITSWAFLGFKEAFKKGALILGSALISIILILMVVYFPIPKPGSFSADSFAKRISLDGSEAAVASRWSLLPVMWEEIKTAPVFGYGYGKTITYKTSDPRVLENNPDGLYTTYAFEWGYLAIWLKLGLVGLGTYLFLLFINIYQGFLLIKDKKITLVAFSFGLLALIIINFFTPYLDHPLGIAYLIFTSIILDSKRETQDLPETIK